jgi:hypothetical protein
MPKKGKRTLAAEYWHNICFVKFINFLTIKSSSAMTRYMTLLILLVTSFATKAQTPTFSWARQINGNLVTNATACDAMGNFYSTGVFVGTVYYTTSSGTDSITDHGFGDVFITKTDSAGNLLWVKELGGTSYDQGNGIATDASGNVFITGFFNNDSTDFDPGPGHYYLSAFENTFVLKLNLAGDFVWAKQLCSFNENYAFGLNVDHAGNVLVTGKFDGTADFDPGTAGDSLYTLTPSIYIWKLTNDGNYVWARAIDANITSSTTQSIASDNIGNVYVSGLLFGTLDVDPGAGTFNLTNPSAVHAAFILKLSPSGNFVWAVKLDSVDAQINGNNLLVDPQGNSYLAGYFSGNIDFDPGPGNHRLLGTTPNNDFLLKLDSNANFVWVNQLSNLKSMAMGSDASTYIGGSDSLRKFAADGTQLWAMNSFSSMINVDPMGDIYSTGTFTGTLDFDPSASVYNMSVDTTMLNVYIYKLHDPQTITSVDHTTIMTSSMSIYPNPASTQLSITADPALYHTLSITNTLGQELIIQTISTTSTHVSIGALAPGCYYVTLKGQGGSVVRKVVKM